MNNPNHHSQQGPKCNKRKMSLLVAQFSMDEIKWKQKQGNQRRRERQFYWCEQCQAYHFTSEERKQPRFDSHFGKAKHKANAKQSAKVHFSRRGR